MTVKKKITCIFLCITVLISLFQAAFAEEGKKIFRAGFISPAAEAYAGEVIGFDVLFSECNTEFSSCVYFEVNGSRSIDYTFTDFEVKNDAKATFYWEADESLIGKTSEIDFVVSVSGIEIYRVSHEINVLAEPPFVINFDCSFIGFQETVNPGNTMYAEINCKNYGSEFSCTAYFTVAGIKQPDYTMEGFWMRDGRRATFYWQADESLLDKEVAIGFVVEKDGKILSRIEKNVAVISYNAELDPAYVINMVHPVYVEATVRYTTDKYSDIGLTRKTGTVAKGTKVICISSKSDFSNQVALPDGSVCCVPLQALSISTKNYTIADNMSAQQKAVYVNAMGYTSDTNYLIWVNLERQRVNVFTKASSGWKHEKTFPCASGTNPNPTITGVFKYYARQKSWDYNTYYVGPILIFSGNYALHSVLMRYDGSIYDGTVGRPASHGCVRLLPEDIGWIDSYVPRGTTVVIK